MKVTLKPVSHPDMREIIIEEALFHVGRREDPFASLDIGAVAKLSRRHARIFREHNDVYIVDLGSLNGTLINNRRVEKEPVRIDCGDEINLGGELSFRVDIEGEPDDVTTVASLPSTTLVLSPVDASSDIEPIVVTQFPFLVARSDDVFGRYKDRFPEDVGLLSRRHAVFSLKGSGVYLEDLKSANGTLVSGKKLDEHAHLLTDGDLITFGTDRFRYTVHLEKPDQDDVKTGTVPLSGVTRIDTTRIDPTQSPIDEDNPRTTFVSSPASFLDIFCDQGDDGDDVDSDPAAAQHGGRNKALSSTSGKGVIGALWKAVNGQSSISRKPLWAGLAVVSLLLAAGIGVFLLGQDRREIKTLLDAGAYLDSAGAANRYLSSDPGDVEVGAWAQEALLKATIPGWVEQLDQGRFEAAEARLAAASGNSKAIPDGQEMLDLLAWATRVEAHIAARGGVAAPLEIFRHETQIKALVEQWNTNPARHQQLLTQMATFAPSFEPAYTRVLSDLRVLRNEHSLFGKAIADLKTTLKHQLRSNQHDRIRTAIGEFARQYPRIAGVEALQEDAQNYETLVRHMEQGELIQVVRLSREFEFQTPLFKEKVRGWLDQSLPPPEIVMRYEAAAQAWRAGEHNESIVILEGLASQPWGDVATHRAERQKKVLAAYQALQNNRQSASYRDQLLAFWASLRQPEDSDFLRALEAEFNSYKDQLLEQLAQSFKSTRRDWNAYRNDGGIPAVIRVEERISKRFKTQAERLSNAYAAVRDGTHTYDLIRVQPPAEWQQLWVDIGNETKRQRRSLQDLHLVMEPDLLKSKLDLLPRIQEHRP